MKNAILVGSSALAISVAMLAFGFWAGSPPQQERAESHSRFSALGRSEIGTLAHDYLLSNPHVLAEVQEALEFREREGERLAQLQTIRTAADDIFNAEFDGVYGNPDGDVTVVEFFDYNCGFCKRALADMETMVENDPGLRFVLKEFPILGPDSQRAHVVSMAFRMLAPERYGEFHTALMGSAGRATEESAIRLALSLGVEEEALRAQMADPSILAAFELNFDLAARLSVSGTPSYVIGEEVVYGAVGAGQLSEKVELARAEAATSSQ